MPNVSSPGSWYDAVIFGYVGFVLVDEGSVRITQEILFLYQRACTSQLAAEVNNGNSNSYRMGYVTQRLTSKPFSLDAETHYGRSDSPMSQRSNSKKILRGHEGGGGAYVTQSEQAARECVGSREAVYFTIICTAAAVFSHFCGEKPGLKLPPLQLRTAADMCTVPKCQHSCAAPAIHFALPEWYHTVFLE